MLHSPRHFIHSCLLLESPPWQAASWVGSWQKVSSLLTFHGKFTHHQCMGAAPSCPLSLPHLSNYFSCSNWPRAKVDVHSPTGTPLPSFSIKRGRTHGGQGSLSTNTALPSQQQLHPKRTAWSSPCISGVGDRGCNCSKAIFVASLVTPGCLHVGKWCSGPSVY